MANSKPYNPRAAQPGQVVFAADTGITWDTASRPSAIEYKTGEIRRTVITIPQFSFATTAAAKAIGQKVYTFPEGWILPLAARVKLVSTTGATTAATAGEVGLGTTVASGAVAVLSGTAGFQDILDGKTLSNHVAQTALTSHVAHAAGGTSGTMDISDGTATAKPVYLNIASTFDGTGGVTATAVVELLWIHVGDK